MGVAELSHTPQGTGVGQWAGRGPHSSGLGLSASSLLQLLEEDCPVAGGVLGPLQEARHQREGQRGGACVGAEGWGGRASGFPALSCQSRPKEAVEWVRRDQRPRGQEKTNHTPHPPPPLQWALLLPREMERRKPQSSGAREESGCEGGAARRDLNKVEGRRPELLGLLACQALG